jgi:pimeloyl-ACP methyl ester carboxylesterase
VPDPAGERPTPPPCVALPVAPDPVTARDGTRIAAYRFGGDGPPVVLVHATGFHAHVWMPWLEPLRPRFAVYAFDLRGHGESETPEAFEAYRYETLGEDLLSVARHFGFRHCYAIGHSVGGAVIVQAEVLSPGTVERAVLFEPIILPADVSAPTQRVDAAERRRRVFASTADMLDRWRARPPFASFTPDALRSYVEHGVRRRPDGQVELKCSRHAEVSTFLQDIRSDLWTRLGDYRPPTLVLAGDRSDSRAAPLAQSQARVMANARAERVADLSHFLPFERPAEMAARAIAFLRDLESPDTTLEKGA